MVGTRPRAGTVALLGFPLVAWAVATLFFGGDLGRGADDYTMLQRDPVSGELDLPALQEYPFYYRPAFLFVGYNLVTLCFGREWIVHVLMALVHGSVAFLLYSVLRRARVGVLPAAAGALVFVVAPQCHEAVFWMAAMGYGVALASFLALALLMLRYALDGTVSPWLLFLLALSVPCWNEQVAAAIPALPLLCLAARPADQPLRRVALRALRGTGVCLLAPALYLAPLVGAGPAGLRGSAGTLITAGEFLPRLTDVADQLRRWSLGWWGSDIVVGGLIRAREELHSPRALLALGLLALTGVLFAARWPRSQAAGATTGGGHGLLWLALFGLCVVVLSLVPSAVIRGQPIGSRQCAVPAAGLAIVAASAMAPFLRASRSTAIRWASGVLGAALVAVAATLAVSMVGAQGLYRDRARLDRSVPEQLAALVPDPLPGTVFVPLEARVRVGRTRRPWFDLPAAWYEHYAILPLMREVFGRADIGVTPLDPWIGLDLRELTTDSFAVPFWMDVRSAECVPGPTTRIPWRQTVPFVIDGHGRVTLVRRVWIERVGGDDLVIADTRAPPQAAAVASFVIEDREAGRVEPLAGWWLASDPARIAVPLERRRAFGLERATLDLGATPTQRLVVGVAAAPVASRLVLRVACAGQPDPPGALAVRCSWESGPETALHELALAFADLHQHGRWVPLVIELAALPAGRRLCLEIARDAPGEILLTPGVRVFSDARDD